MAGDVNFDKDHLDYISRLPSLIGDLKVVVTGSQPINVTESLTSTKRIYNASFVETTALDATITIQSITCNPDQKVGIIPLKGVTVTAASLAWTFKKEGVNAQVVEQYLNNTSVLPVSLRATNLNPLSITSGSSIQERTFTIVGDDGLENPGSIATASTTLQFGNRIYFGELGQYFDSSSDNTLVGAAILGLPNTILADCLNFFMTPQSLSGSFYLYIAVPTDLGNPIFDDINDPPTEDPMSLIKTLTISNGVSNYSYRIYRSKSSALKGANIKIVQR